MAFYQFFLGASVLHRGLDRPFVLWGQIGILSSLISLIVVAGCGIGAGFTARRGCELRDGLLVVGWILALWSILGTTMDQWLAINHPHTGSGTSKPYMALLPDYLTLGGVAGLVALVFLRRGAQSPAASTMKPATGGKNSFADGLKALGMLVLIAAVILAVATGPRFDQTRHGQNAFAAFVAFFVGVAFARKSTQVNSPMWYWPAPILVGLIGVFYAISRPGLPPPYDQINNIPCWGPVRLLPAEMIGVGLLGTLWSLRSTSESHEAS